MRRGAAIRSNRVTDNGSGCAREQGRCPGARDRASQRPIGMSKGSSYGAGRGRLTCSLPSRRRKGATGPNLPRSPVRPRVANASMNHAADGPCSHAPPQRLVGELSSLPDVPLAQQPAPGRRRCRRANRLSCRQLPARQEKNSTDSPDHFYLRHFQLPESLTRGREGGFGHRMPEIVGGCVADHARSSAGP